MLCSTAHATIVAGRSDCDRLFNALRLLNLSTLNHQLFCPVFYETDRPTKNSLEKKWIETTQRKNRKRFRRRNPAKDFRPNEMILILGAQAASPPQDGFAAVTLVSAGSRNAFLGPHVCVSWYRASRSRTSVAIKSLLRPQEPARAVRTF